MVSVGTTSSFGFDTSDAFFQNGGANAKAPIPSGVLYENSSNPSSDHHMMIVDLSVVEKAIGGKLVQPPISGRPGAPHPKKKKAAKA